MIRLVHLSDLHFGFHRAALVEPLLARLNAAGADLIVLTGDLTHRGRAHQFAQVASFLSRLSAPWMAVPGNHDLPLFNPGVRLLRPRHNYRRLISPVTEPVRRLGQVQVLGIDSSDRFAHQRGVFSAAQVGRVCATMAPTGTHVVALHHPMQQRPGVDKLPMRGARAALDRIEAAGAHIVLTGHLHVWGAAPDFAGHPGRRLLQVQAGTTLCARPSDRQNEYAVLDIDGPALRIERHVAPMDGPGFAPPEILRFSRADGPWRQL